MPDMHKPAESSDEQPPDPAGEQQPSEDEAEDDAKFDEWLRLLGRFGPT